MNGYSLMVTGYSGHEEKVLEMRNRNREFPQTRQFLDWRYLGEKADRKPVVFWLQDARNEPIGLASIIFRPYLIGGRSVLFAVLGDIAIDREYRGMGLSPQFFWEINAYLDTHSCAPAFVIPNKAAGASLGKAGWIQVGRLVPYVFLIGLESKSQKLFSSPRLTDVFSQIYRKGINALLSCKIQSILTLEESDDFDEDLELFWRDFPKSELIMRDHGIATLRWRYLKQPESKYRITKIKHGNRLVGYLVSNTDQLSICHISELIVSDLKWLQPALAGYVKELLSTKKVNSVRFILNKASPYVSRVRALGFFPREPVTTFQTYGGVIPQEYTARDWLIMPGDKDA